MAETCYRIIYIFHWKTVKVVPIASFHGFQHNNPLEANTVKNTQYSMGKVGSSMPDNIRNLIKFLEVLLYIQGRNTQDYIYQIRSQGYSLMGGEESRF